MTWYPTVTTSGPAVEPVLIADARMQCGVEAGDTTYDTELTAFAASARAFVEAITGTRMINQTVAMRCDGWADLAHLPMAPLSAITSIGYVDGAGDSQTLSTDVYEARLFGLTPHVVLKYGQSWPTIRAGSLITVTATAGYGAAGSNVPQDLIHAVRLTIAQMFEERETSDPGFMMTLNSLICNHRVWS